MKVLQEEQMTLWTCNGPMIFAKDLDQDVLVDYMTGFL